jgi:thioesterase domain-containing protein
MALVTVEAMHTQQANGPYYIAGYSSGGIVAYEMAQQLYASGKETVLMLMDSNLNRIQKKMSLAEIKARGIRWLQECIYFKLLHPKGLPRLRIFSSGGEAHRWARWSYVPREYTGKVEFILAASSGDSERDSLLGWKHLLKGTVNVHTVPGNHGTIVKSPNVEVLAESVLAILDNQVSK